MNLLSKLRQLRWPAAAPPHGTGGNNGDEALQTPVRLPRNLMIALALVQGVALLLLWRAASEGAWLPEVPALNIPLWTLAVAWPMLLLLSLEADRIGRVFALVSLFSALLAVLGIYVGWQASPFGAFPVEPLLAAYALTLLIACFMALMYLQQFAARGPIRYDMLFAHSWRNFLVALLSGAFALGVALVLTLWAALFSAIGIDLFTDLFTNDWFLFPVLSVALGLGVYIFRRLTKVIDGITSLLEGLMRLLLPLLAIVCSIFLVALPLTGLQPLWDTGNGTAMVMWLNALALFTVNAVYQTGRNPPPYPLAIHRSLYVCIALLPALSVLALYGLSLRVAQYGWTVERCWAFTAALLLAAFSVGYSFSILRWRDGWPGGFARVNTAMGWVVLALMLLVNSPLLDFRSISLASQLARVEVGEVDLADFDFDYARNFLARPAWLEMQALIELHGDSDPELVQRITGQTPERDLWANMAYRPTAFELPAGLRTAIDESYENRRKTPDSVLVKVDLDGDGVPEYAIVDADQHFASGHVYYQEEGEWRFVYISVHGHIDIADLPLMLREGDIEVVGPGLRDLKIGDLVFRR